MKNQILILFIGCLFIFSGCHKVKHESDFASYAMTLMDSTLMYYKVPGQVLFYETYPKRDADLVTYLAGADTIRKNRVAYLWPTSGMFSALNALQKTTGDKKYENMIESVILPGLECYFDSLRVPGCYQSYLTEGGKSDRFYDDNLWLGLDFLDLYEHTKNLKIKAEISLFIIYHCFSDNTFQAINDSLIYMNLNNNLNRGFVYKTILIISLLNMFIRY